MINYSSAIRILANAGYTMTNKCYFDGEIFHDFNSKKKDACVSLIVDESTGSVSRVEVSTRKWENGRYVPVKEVITGLQQLIDKFAPRNVTSL